jgi:hypothetical protein
MPYSTLQAVAEYLKSQPTGIRGIRWSGCRCDDHYEIWAAVENPELYHRHIAVMFTIDVKDNKLAIRKHTVKFECELAQPDSLDRAGAWMKRRLREVVPHTDGETTC